MKCRTMNGPHRAKAHRSGAQRNDLQVECLFERLAKLGATGLQSSERRDRHSARGQPEGAERFRNADGKGHERHGFSPRKSAN